MVARRRFARATAAESAESHAPSKSAKPRQSGSKDSKSDDFGLTPLEEQGAFLLFDEVNQHTAADAVRWIMESNFANNQDMLTLIVCSEGGEVHAGFALIDAMFGSRIPIRTIGLGLIASMGLSIFLAGEKGHRILTPNTLVLSHQWSGANWGKQHELIAHQKSNDIVTDMLMKHYRRCTGLSIKEVQKHLFPPSDVFLTSDESLELGICDEVKKLR